jgi:hypothetical protein
MKNFVRFSDWEKTLKKESTGSQIGSQIQEEKEEVLSNSKLISELNDLVDKRKKSLKASNTYEAQILEISIKLKKLEIEKVELLRKQKDLSEAMELSKKNNVEGRTQDQK